MKKNGLLKVLIILVIIAICLISFVGIYKKEKTNMISVLPEYKKTMNLGGQRQVVLEVSDETKEVIYDSEGNVSSDGLDEDGNLKEGYTKQEEKVNKDEILTEENYAIAKEIIEKRLKKLNVEDYIVRQDIKTGNIEVTLPENNDTNRVTEYLTYQGKFEITDSQTRGSINE